MKRKTFIILICLLVGAILAGCQPSQGEARVRVTQIFAETSAPQTVEVPPSTDTPPNAPTFTPTPTPCLPDATFGEHVTAANGTTFASGTTFTKTWRMTSNGCTAWPAGTSWVFVAGDQMRAPASVAVPDTPLGETVDISVELTAPDTPGTYRAAWQMQGPDGTPIGDQVEVEIVVSPAPPRQLPNGTAIKEVGSRDGQGSLHIDNGRELDAVAVLSMIDGSAMIAVYVQGESEFTIPDIEDGTYELYFQLGEDWDPDQAEFTRKRSLARFEAPFDFKTTALTYSTWSVTLHEVTQGTAATDAVSEDDFPPLK